MAKKAYTTKTRRYKYDRAEGYCLPSWLTPFDGHARRFGALERMKGATPKAKDYSRRVALLVALRQEITDVLSGLLVTYPGSHAERDYKDLYLQVRQLEAKLQKNTQEV